VLLVYDAVSVGDGIMATPHFPSYVARKLDSRFLHNKLSGEFDLCLISLCYNAYPMLTSKVYFFFYIFYKVLKDPQQFRL